MTPRILVIDLETSPDISYHWERFDTNIGIDQTLIRGGVMCWAAKWHGGKKIEFRSDWGDGHEAQVLRAHELLSEADIVVHFNGRSFDERHLNREFDLAKLGPPAPFQRIDLMRVGRGRFRYSSGKLDNYLLEKGLTRKVQTSGFDLWRKCLNYLDEYGEAEVSRARRDMQRYNMQDVDSTDELYVDWRDHGWINNHPNVGLYADGETDRCPSCGSTELKPQGFALTNTGKFQRFRCADCGSWSRSNKRIDGVRIQGVAA